MTSDQDVRLAERWHAVRNGVADACRRAGRDPASVSLVAISKFQPAEAIAAIAALGQRDFGENYIQEAVAKQEHLRALLPQTPLRWHATGHIQSNKARDVAGRFTLIHTLDSVKLATALSRKMDAPLAAAPAAAAMKEQPCLIQVNVGRESQKSGVTGEALPPLLEALLSIPHIAIHGLMCLPPNCGDGESTRPYFTQVRLLRDAMEQRFGISLPHLSMGMSGDYVQAIEEGSTLVRIGTDIFGSRRS